MTILWKGRLYTNSHHHCAAQPKLVETSGKQVAGEKIQNSTNPNTEFFPQEWWTKAELKQQRLLYKEVSLCFCCVCEQALVCYLCKQYVSNLLYVGDTRV